MGLSSRIASLDALGPRFWAEDAIAVLDAIGCEQASIFAPSFNAVAALVLAADYPERVRSLVIVYSDVRDTLARVAAPTLILHRADLEFIPVGHGRYLGEHIAGSRYVELAGADAL